MQMDIASFRGVFIDHKDLSKPLTVVPEDFNDESPVVVIELNHTQAGEVLGVSKVKGGNRMATTYLAAMCVVFRPKEATCTLWLTV
jgi:hypothetical protein